MSETHPDPVDSGEYEPATRLGMVTRAGAQRARPAADASWGVRPPSLADWAVPAGPTGPPVAATTAGWQSWPRTPTPRPRPLRPVRAGAEPPSPDETGSGPATGRCAPGLARPWPRRRAGHR